MHSSFATAQAAGHQMQCSLRGDQPQIFLIAALITKGK